jgi:glycine hydroxymethyltransferase
MVASQNIAPLAVLEAQGSVLSNKYADGYPGHRHYDGCEVVDEVELLAIDRAKDLFGAGHANVQPYSGASANAAVLWALAQPGETILGFDFAQGGHPSQHSDETAAGRFYNSVTYGVREEDGLLDYGEIGRIAHDNQPKVIFAGGSCYPRQIDFSRFRAIADEVGAYLVADIAHIAGLVAAKLHPDPVPFVDVCTMTVHKTLGGARGGMILSTKDLAERIDAAVYPGEQGGPLMHAIAGKAVTLLLAQQSAFTELMGRTVRGARIIAEIFDQATDETKISVLTGGTDTHLFALDTFGAGLTGSRALTWMHFLGVTGNAMTIPFDRAAPPECSGLRLGAAGLATRGFTEEDFRELGDVLLTRFLDPSGPTLVDLRSRTKTLCDRYPIYADQA